MSFFGPPPSPALPSMKFDLERVCCVCLIEEHLSGYGNPPLNDTCRCGAQYQDRRLDYSYPNYYFGPNIYRNSPGLTIEKITREKKDLPKISHTGLLVGFRYWLATNYKLTPIAVGQSWQPGVNKAGCSVHDLLTTTAFMLTTADTTNDTPADQHAPDANCACGFHLRAIPDPIDLSHAQVNKDHAILGACLAWGRCHMHGTAGARVQYARPILLAYDPSWPKAKQGLVKGLAQDYDCRAMPVDYPSIEKGVCEQLLEAAREYGQLMNEMDTDA